MTLMRNTLSRVLALILALMMTLSCASVLAEGADDPVLFTYDGEPVTQSVIEEALLNLIYAGYASEGDYDLAVEYYVQDHVLEAKIAELGFDQFTEEEEEAFRAEAAKEWAEAIQTYVDYYLTENTEEAIAAMREEAVAYFTSLGYSEEMLYTSLKLSDSYSRLEQYIIKDKDAAVTAEEIKAEFDATVAEDQKYVENNVMLYEYYHNYLGYDFWYLPAGYRGIIHILLSVDEDLLTAFTNAQAAYEESVTEEQPEGDADLKAALDAAKEAVLASKQNVIDDIYARLGSGEAFTALIAEYGEDPGMSDPEYLNGGYPVHKESIVYDPAFAAGAFSEKMNQPGDVSDPVVGSYGIHILYYLRDIPGGPVEMTDEISAEIEQALNTEKLNAIYAEALESWIAEHEIVYNQEAIDALKTAE